MPGADPYRWGREKLPERVEFEQGQPAVLENTAGQEIDPATEQTLASIDTALAGTLPVEQQTAIAVEDTGANAIDPAEQPTFGATYTAVDENATGSTTLYDPVTEAEVDSVFVDNPGSTAVLLLEVTDGTDTAVISRGAAGEPVSLTTPLKLDAGQSVQVTVDTAEGAAQSVTAVVSHGEL